MICSIFRLSIFIAWLMCCTATFAQWDPPSNYYDNATGTGPALKAQLTAAMSENHMQRSYSDFRESAAIHDQDPANSSRIILAYSGASNSSAWDSAATWNREHVWPQSRQPTSSSNGNLGDPHALRPCNTQVNSNRGNLPFGLYNTTGNFRDLGTYWYVGDMCRGDIARSLFYSETRWASQQLELVNGVPSGNRQMGDLASLIEWHYLDPPDEFERRRNHTIFSSQYNPQYYTNNRNAFIDHPEFVWSIWMDQSNDSTITIAGGTSNADGSSMLEIDFGTVIVGTPVSPTQTITLNKAGNDGTYYLVEAVGDAASDREGSSNAFPIITSSTDSSTMNVSLASNQATAGLYDGMIIIDNLDITTQGGVGNGSQDGNDLIDMTLKVLDHANGSFASGTDMNSMTVDLGEIPLGQPITPMDFSVHNLASQAGASLTAAMELDSVNSLPQTSFLSYTGPTFTDLAGGESVQLSIGGTPSALGAGTTFFQIRVSDEDIPGATLQTLQLFVTYDVVDAFLLGDANMDGVVDFADIPAFIAILSSGGYLDEADINQDGAVDFGDIPAFIAILTSQ